MSNPGGYGYVVIETWDGETRRTSPCPLELLTPERIVEYAGITGSPLKAWRIVEIEDNEEPKPCINF